MEKTDKLQPGMVVQLSPNVANPMFACCFMIISEPKPFGAQGYVQALGENGKMGSQAYYRANWDEMELVGQAVWAVAYDNE
jgi:hypothetical protein